MDKNCLSYWFPRLVGAGLPLPQTQIVRTGVDLTPLLDGCTPDGFEGFHAELLTACERIGFPLFLRTGQGAGKHQWRKTCFLRQPGDLAQHVAALVEWSHTVDFLGLPHDVWCARELLPVTPLAVLPAYGDMPLVREVRGFVADGMVICRHPYWPATAIREGFPLKMSADWTDAEKPLQRELPADFDALVRQAQTFTPAEQSFHAALLGRVARSFAGDGAWSVDIIETQRGWMVTDCALAERSFHWPGCPCAEALAVLGHSTGVPS